MSPKPTSESTSDQTIEIEKGQAFKITTLAATGLKKIPQNNLDNTLLQPELGMALAQKQIAQLEDKGVDSQTASIVAAFGDPVQWDAQAEMYKQRIAEGFTGLGLGFATAAGVDSVSVPRSRKFYELWTEARKQFGDKIKDPSLLACQCAVIPVSMIDLPTPASIIQNVKFVMQELQKVGIQDRYTLGLLGAHFSYFAAAFGYGELPYSGIAHYHDTLKKRLSIDDLNAALLTISPVVNPVQPTHRYFIGGENRYINLTETVFNKAKQMS